MLIESKGEMMMVMVSGRLVVKAYAQKVKTKVWRDYFN